MAGNNPVFGKIDKELREQSYAGFGQPAQQQPGYPSAYPAPVDADQLETMWQRPSAGPLQTGRVTFDDVVMKTLSLFAVLLLTAAATWVVTSAQPQLVTPIWLVGMFGGLVLGLVIAFMKKVSVPLILGYAILEGAFVGAFSRVMEAWYPGIVMTAVVATLATFAGMFLGYRMGFIKVTSRSRRIFGMALMGYLLFSLANVVALMFGWTHGWGFGGSGKIGRAHV